jgi:hypothetical protein
MAEVACAVGVLNPPCIRFSCDMRERHRVRLDSLDWIFLSAALVCVGRGGAASDDRPSSLGNAK